MLMTSPRVCSQRHALKRVKRLFSATPASQADFTHVVIGAGVVGLAIAHRLAVTHPMSRTLLLDRRGRAGTETSSRNSCVIHAGLYHPPHALKTTLCHRGRRLLYALCDEHAIPHRRTGKWIVAQESAQADALAAVHARAQAYGEGAVPTRWVGRAEARRREPDVRAEAALLESESSGIVDVHRLMDWLEGRFGDLGGDVAYGAEVRGLEPQPDGNIAVHTGAPVAREGGAPHENADDETANATITAESVINSAGLGSIIVANLLLPAARQVKARFARGNYFSYSAPAPKPSVLVYPAPPHTSGGLGTHLTLDLGNPPRVRFGPDFEPVDYDPIKDVVRSADGAEERPYEPSANRMQYALHEIKRYLPSLKPEALNVDYCGIRPMVGRDPQADAANDFQDFVIRREEGFGGVFINLLGIESPGLTSALAIAEKVEEMLYR